MPADQQAQLFTVKSACWGSAVALSPVVGKGGAKRNPKDNLV